MYFHFKRKRILITLFNEMFSLLFLFLQIEMSAINEEGKKSTAPVREVTIDTSTSEMPVKTR